MSLVNSNIRLTSTAASIRPPAVAGSFYPDDPNQLELMLNDLLANTTTSGTAPKAIIAPHAGYIYSGSTAAKAYATLATVKNKIKRVVLLGPAHRVALRGIALSNHSHFATPLGTIPVDQNSISKLQQLPQVQILEPAHEQEHSLEVHLPFLQKCLNNFSLVPLVVGQTPPEQVKEVLKMLWGGEETLIVISSDLSHFHDYATAQKMDTATSAAIAALQLEKIGPQQACGCMPLSGLLALARDEHMKITVLDTINSGDTAGSYDRVVGYGAYTVFEDKGYSSHDKELLLKLAWQTIQTGVTTGKKIAINLAEFSPSLTADRATFVTINKNGKLRGCIGTLQAVEPLLHSVINSAWKAAFQDPRFPALEASELADIEINISILTPATVLNFTDEADLIAKLRPCIDGLIIIQAQHQATFLPSVWESINSPDKFLKQLKLKAGIPPSQAVEQALIYQTISFGSA